MSPIPFSSQVGGLQRLPTELTLIILSVLDKADLKAFRCVDKACCQVVSPLLFETVSFHFDEGGIDRVEAISGKGELARSVRSLILRRKRGLEEFNDASDWLRCTIYESLRDSESLDRELRDWAMSPREWDGLAYEDRMQMYQEYEADRLTSFNDMGRIASELTSRISPSRTPAVGESVGVGVVSRFETSLDRLRHVSHFGNRPHFDSEPWEMRWRRVQFTSGGSSGEVSEADKDIEDLQLFVALHAFSLSRSKSPTSMDLYLRGPAFFGANRLCHLLCWRVQPDGHGTLESFEHDQRQQIERWLQEGHSSRRISRRIETTTRSLVSVERIFGHVARLRLRLHTDGYRYYDLIASASGLSKWIEQGRNLSALTIWFGEESWNSTIEEPFYAVTTGGKSQRVQFRTRKSAMTSPTLLTALEQSGCLPNLRELSFSLPMGSGALLGLLSRTSSLRHLELRYVALLDQTVEWEEVLHGIAERLQLESIKIRWLEDIRDKQARLLLDPEDPVWPSVSILSPVENLYDLHEQEICDFLLHRSPRLPPLSATAWLREHGRPVN